MKALGMWQQLDALAKTASANSNGVTVVCEHRWLKHEPVTGVRVHHNSKLVILYTDFLTAEQDALAPYTINQATKTAKADYDVHVLAIQDDESIRVAGLVGYFRDPASRNTWNTPQFRTNIGTSGKASYNDEGRFILECEVMSNYETIQGLATYMALHSTDLPETLVNDVAELYASANKTLGFNR